MLVVSGPLNRVSRRTFRGISFSFPHYFLHSFPESPYITISPFPVSVSPFHPSANLPFCPPSAFLPSLSLGKLCTRLTAGPGLVQWHLGEPTRACGGLTFPCIPFPTLFILFVLLAAPIFLPLPAFFSPPRSQTYQYFITPQSSAVFIYLIYASPLLHSGDPN